MRWTKTRINKLLRRRRKASGGKALASLAAPLPLETVVRELVIVIPMPPRSQNPNFRSRGWQCRWREGRQYRKTVGELAGYAKKEAGMRGRFAAARLHITALCSRAATRDDDNLVGSLKPARDGLVDAGIVGNDRDLRLGDVTIAGRTVGGDDVIQLRIVCEERAAP